jgi:hypothetical protein
MRQPGTPSYWSDTAIPAGLIWNVFPFATVTGCPVHVPNRYLTVAPEFQISSPTRDQDVPPFVHDTVSEFDVAAADTLFQVIVEPPVVYPVPDSWVMLLVAVGAFVPSRMLVADTAEKAVSLSSRASRSPAIVWSKQATRTPRNL